MTTETLEPCSCICHQLITRCARCSGTPCRDGRIGDSSEMILREDAVHVAMSHDRTHGSGYRCYEGEAIAEKIAKLPPASTAPVVDEQRGEPMPEAEIQAAIAASKERLHWPFTVKHDNCVVCAKEYEAPPAAATAACQVEPVTRDLLSAFKELIKWHHMAAKHGGSADECEWAVCVGYKQIAEDCDAAPVEQSDQEPHIPTPLTGINCAYSRHGYCDKQDCDCSCHINEKAR